MVGIWIQLAEFSFIVSLPAHTLHLRSALREYINSPQFIEGRADSGRYSVNISERLNYPFLFFTYNLIFKIFSKNYDICIAATNFPPKEKKSYHTSTVLFIWSIRKSINVIANTIHKPQESNSIQNHGVEWLRIMSIRDT